MGMFSWLTGDTKQSIAVSGTRHKNAGRTVYLLQPNGKPSIAENDYQGYGVFGGVDAYEWLSEMNVGIKDNDVGVMLEVGDILRDKDGQFHVYSGDLTKAFLSVLKKNVPESVTFNGFDNYGVTLGGKFGDVKDVNALVESGELVMVPVSEIVPVKYPLKFSFDQGAKYENIDASEVCSN